GESTLGAGIDQDRSLRTRRAEGGRDQHARGDQAAQRVLIATHRDGDEFSCGNGALRQVGGETNGLAIMAGTERRSQLRSLGRDSPQLEWTLTSQKNRDQPRTQEEAEAVGERLGNGVYIRSSVQRTRYLGQHLGATVLLARDFAQPGRLQQAAQLSGENGRLGGKVLGKEL